MIRLALLGSAAALALVAPAAAQDFTITNATVATGDGSEPVENATVVVRNGRIVAAGAGISVPAGGEVIDGTGKWVTPGIFSAVTDLGLSDVDGVSESNDTAAGNSPFSAALDASTALNPNSQDVMVARADGITRASVSTRPSASIFGGQGAVIDLGADPEMVTRPRAFQLVDLGETGARISGGSRTSAHALLRNALREAQSYGDRAAIGAATARPSDTSFGDDVPLDPRLSGRDSERAGDVLLTRFDAAALVPVVRGEQPLYVVAERASDIREAIRLKRDFPRLDLVILGASEGWLVANEIAAANVPVIADPLDDLPTGFDQLAATQSNIGRMRDAGVTVAIGRMSGGTGEQPRNARQYAGNLVALSRVPGATGLTWGEALATITSIPAQISGFGGRLGTLSQNAAADVVIWDGDPLEVGTVPEAVFIDGVRQPTDTHQSGLRERYRDLNEADLPQAYDW
ncbi:MULTISPECIES: amidohydrolase family protein [Citromicrobium]|uniref:amidohydrolase family protein n=1 Tax=Citromicrobium TaxID=72173 RepID=UPI0001DD07D0|nr:MULTISPECIES: amidohydrolase family protein [Citromicrobium]ALG59589.1 amidohydrolase [Citromicrobium sp. JL477]KPM17304.1 amidohydrolase [Citromicrobium sp. JL1351]KPM20242.1 amidohydrolase [Citromicrobium sp. JL31]KPM29214.1 amidohydrolase [Citromicrobium sp. JL2201]